MTSWSLKKKNQQEILKVSHALVFVFFKDFWNLLKKKQKHKSLMLTETITESPCIEKSLNKKSFWAPHIYSTYLLHIKSF